MTTLADLTARQREILRLMAGGMSDKEIAAALGLSAQTVRHHVAAIYERLDLRGRFGNPRVVAVIWWLRHGGLAR